MSATSSRRGAVIFGPNFSKSDLVKATDLEGAPDNTLENYNCFDWP